MDLAEKLKEIEDGLPRTHTKVETFRAGLSNDKFVTRFTVHIKEEYSDLNKVLNTYFSEVGLPIFVEAGSDYESVEFMLKDHQKILKRKSPGILNGKYIVSRYNK